MGSLGEGGEKPSRGQRKQAQAGSSGAEARVVLGKHLPLVNVSKGQGDELTQWALAGMTEGAQMC